MCEEGEELYQKCLEKADYDVGEAFVLMDASVTDLESECRFMLGMYGDHALEQAKEWAMDGELWYTKSGYPVAVSHSYNPVVEKLKTYYKFPHMSEHEQLQVYKEAVCKFLHSECDGLSRSAALEFAGLFGLTEETIELCGYTLPAAKE